MAGPCKEDKWGENLKIHNTPPPTRLYFLNSLQNSVDCHLWSKYLKLSDNLFMDFLWYVFWILHKKIYKDVKKKLVQSFKGTYKKLNHLMCILYILEILSCRIVNSKSWSKRCFFISNFRFIRRIQIQPIPHIENGIKRFLCIHKAYPQILLKKK